MKTFSHPTKYTLETLVPGMILTRKFYSGDSPNIQYENTKYILISIRNNSNYPMELKRITMNPFDDSDTNFHCLYGPSGTSFWEEIEDKQV